VKLIVSLLLIAQAAAAATVERSPLEREFNRLRKKGYEPVAKARTRVRGGALVVVLYEGGGRERVNIYLVDKKRARMIGMEPGSTLDLALDQIHSQGRIPDLLGDGSRVIAYRTIFPRLDQENLVVMRYAGGRLQRLGRIPFGRFEQLDKGPPEIVSKERPLGKGFQITCRDFLTMAETAFSHRIYAWQRGKPVPASKHYPAFFEGLRKELMEEVSAVSEARSQEDHGRFLALTLSVFFTYDEIGRGKEGWKVFRSLYPEQRVEPSAVKKCRKKMENDLKRELDIPEDW